MEHEQTQVHSQPQVQAQAQPPKPQPQPKPQPKPQAPTRWVDVDQNTKDIHGKPLNPGIPDATGKVFREDTDQKVSYLYVYNGKFEQPFTVQSGVPYRIEWYTNQPTQQIGAQSFKV